MKSTPPSLARLKYLGALSLELGSCFVYVLRHLRLRQRTLFPGNFQDGLTVAMTTTTSLDMIDEHYGIKRRLNLSAF